MKLRSVTVEPKGASAVGSSASDALNTVTRLPDAAAKNGPSPLQSSVAATASTQAPERDLVVPSSCTARTRAAAEGSLLPHASTTARSTSQTRAAPSHPPLTRNRPADASASTEPSEWPVSAPSSSPVAPSYSDIAPPSRPMHTTSPRSPTSTTAIVSGNSPPAVSAHHASARGHTPPPNGLSGLSAATVSLGGSAGIALRRPAPGLHCSHARPAHAERARERGKERGR
mmetsp:Transcript_15197/g.63164  ORF Transcript_15197/g.63164 Transcript_15197/m.63164 type:complete len:229 (+) Transcript_15197:778-1464(+)